MNICKCGCGGETTTTWIKGHNWRGTPRGPMSEAQKKLCARPMEKNGRWKGGRMTDKQGYILVKNWEHPNCNNQGYVREHRIVMEKHLGRYLDSKEVVHHINGDKSDNRLENLQLLESVAEHNRIERQGKKFPRKDGLWATCETCGEEFYRSAYFKKNRKPRWCSWDCRYKK